MSVRLTDIVPANETPEAQFKRLGIPTRIDILTAEDQAWVPYAASLLFRARQFLKATKQHLFVRRYVVGDATIFIRIGPGSEYIQIRTGAVGDYLVLPVVRQISIDATTTGAPCFLNNKLTKAAEAVDFPTLADITVRVSKFPHKTASKKFTGAQDASRGYFKKRLVQSDGALALLNYAGIFRHSYIDQTTGNAATEFLHASSRASTPDVSEGLFFHTPALGDQLVAFQTLPSARRPAVHTSMFAKPDGKKVVAEEQFLPGHGTSFEDYFILRSIIDVDLGNAGTPVTLSDFNHLGAYTAADLETGGSSTVAYQYTTSSVPSTPSGFITDTSAIITGEVSYPVSTAINAGGELVNTTVDTTFDSTNIYHDDTGAAAETSNSFSETVSRHIRNSSVMNVSVPTRIREQEGAVTGSAITSPFSRFDLDGTLTIWYSSASLPAAIYTYDEITFDYSNFRNPVRPPANSIDTTRTKNSKRRISFSVGAIDRILSEEVATPVVTDPETVTLAPGTDNHTYAFSPTFPGLVITHSGPGTILVELPDVTDKPNRNWVANRAVTDDIQFAAQSRKSYIGSIFVPYLPEDGTTKKWFTFSHDDAALKKTIVNYVLAPGIPIEDTSDYEIWFTAIRAI